MTILKLDVGALAETRLHAFLECHPIFGRRVRCAFKPVLLSGASTNERSIFTSSCLSLPRAERWLSLMGLGSFCVDAPAFWQQLMFEYNPFDLPVVFLIR
ncbi:hypothetical protein CRM22_005805 [Opisthorchis felineus]|uniref:Uncharacterized protein n=1 Tax=Opisthorchis felineus TaxID=147828 RepID=A0A4S2LVF5_OPIFE|nr:hypothetical protein CRM22_005805 [Opisthorchis felineus]